MSTAALHASAFYEQVAREGSVFSFSDEDSMLIFRIRDQDVTPFWSSRSRMERVQAAHPKYAAYTIDEEPLDRFMRKTLQQLEEEAIQIGVNWSGARLTGYDVSAVELRRNIEYWLNKLAGVDPSDG